MAEMTISLRRNPTTGKQDIIISLQSDADAMPHEHEQQHKALVEKLINGGLVKASELGQITVQREEEKGTPAGPSSNDPTPERRASAQGG